MPVLGGGGGFQRRRRLDAPKSKPRQPLKKDSPLMERLRRQTTETAVRLGRSNFRQAPKPNELPPGYVPARACLIGDQIVAADDHGDCVLEVVEQAPFMTICRDIRTGKLLGVLPDTIVQVAS